MLADAWDRSSRVVLRLLSRDGVFAWWQRGLRGTLVARRLYERNVARMLNRLNVPSHQDVQRLLDRLEGLDENVEELVERVNELAAQDDPPR